MMKPSTLWCWPLLLLAVRADDTWSWGKGKKEPVAVAQKAAFNASVIDDILESGRQGRALQGYDQVYSDPDVQQALTTGNESQARQFIKDRLCGLGLMSCDDGIEPKRPYIEPHDLIYAQPVHIKPVGRPIPALPVGKPIGGHGYGPPRPVPLPSKYGPPSRPYGPPLRPPGPIYSGSRPSPIYEPDLEVPPFRGPSVLEEKKPVVVVNNPGTGSIQQHIHHHIHHSDGGLGLGSVGSLSSIKGPVLGAASTFDTPSYPPLGSSYGSPSISAPGPLYSNSLGSGVSGSSSLYTGADTYYGSPGPFYKKEFNLKGSYSNNAVSSTGASYPSYESPRADRNYDNCVCVPYDQCLPHEIARKEDGYFIDPRNAGDSNIEALGPDDIVITDGNGTMTVVTKHNKREDSESKEPEKEEAKVSEEAKKERRRREAGDQESEATDAIERTKKRGAVADIGTLETEISPRYQVTEEKEEISSGRKFGLGGGDDDEDDSEGSGLKLRPTFGVSFGLPSGGGGYPINPFGYNPAVNPYYGSVGGGGLDLGLVSVNPLLSVQVTKDEYGEKVVKPLVNLHVTPNHGLVHKLGHLVHKFKEPHYGYGPPPFYHHHQHFHAPPPPPIYHKPYYPHKPYGPPYSSYGPYAPSYNSFRSSDDDNYYSPSDDYTPSHDETFDSDYDGPSSYDTSFYRNANISIPSSTSSSSATGSQSSNSVQFPSDRRSSTGSVSFVRRKRDAEDTVNEVVQPEKRQASYYGGRCGPNQVCCRRPLLNAGPGPVYRPQALTQCGRRNTQGINGRIKTPVYVDGDSEFGEYPWQVAILKKDPQESVYVCGGTLIDSLHIITAAHCIKSYTPYDLRVRLGEWDVNHDVEFYPYVERNVVLVQVHPEFYAGTLVNDLAILRMDKAVDFQQNPHISPACLPEPGSEYAGTRCWTTGWGKDAFGDFGKYQNILKEVDVPVVSNHQCQAQLQNTRLGYDFKLHPGFVCAGGEEGKDACKGDGGGPMVCERGGTWQVVGVVSWGIGCGQYGVPGVYVKVSHYLDWIRTITNRF